MQNASTYDLIDFNCIKCMHDFNNGRLPVPEAFKVRVIPVYQRSHFWDKIKVVHPSDIPEIYCSLVVKTS